MKKLFSLLLFVGLVFTLQAQENTLLWKVSGNGLSAPSYVFGTMHVLCDGTIAENPELVAAWEASERLVIELNPADPKLLQEMQQLSVNPGFANIYMDLPEADRQLLDSFFTENFGAGLAQMGVLKPFVLSSMLVTTYLPCEEMFTLEPHFVELAKAREIEVVSLETVASQMGIFDEIPQDFQVEELVKTLRDDKGQEEFANMLALYMSGDVLGLYAQMIESELLQQYQDLVLDNRNLAWIPDLEKLFSQGSSFVAVGAGHLPGELGVLQLLRDRGYTVEAITL
ncbi:TraB/GumN family protein [Nitritalea halalkaliphila]|nr:TraB/GumN family protein [Nitritalea halalkaliphila]